MGKSQKEHKMRIQRILRTEKRTRGDLLKDSWNLEEWKK